MTNVNLRRQPSAALRLRRLSNGHEHARRRAVMDSRLVARSPMRNAGSAYRDRLTGLVAPSIASQTRAQCTSPTERQRPNPHSF
jgi:hypothetical protein